MTTPLLISSRYGGHLENDEGLFTISSLMISEVLFTFFFRYL